MSKTGNIFLVGLMGAGKTTIGKLLAKRLHKTFIDCDHELEHRTGVKIPLIFELEGEAGFREREVALIQELSLREDVVLATGGGAILRAENREALSQNGTVVYLNARVEDLYARTKHDKTRPLLQTANPQAKLHELFQQRDPLYREIADIVITSGHQNVHQAVREVERRLGNPAHPLYSSSMQTLTVALGDRAYPIHIGGGLLNQPGLILPHLKSSQVAIVTNTTVGPLYLERLQRVLQENGVTVLPIILPDGEAYKNDESLKQIYDALLTHRMERKATLIALGGGVIGDLTGFAAATYLRGVPFIQIPTTLLAQVDSSVGGKTGINHPLGKNMIGAFYQPQVVLADTDTLNTLPDRELSAGLAEVIKYGLIRDLPFLEWLETNMDKLHARDAVALSYAIFHSCQNKAEVVAADERESGSRALLNLGHTFGHAIENGMGYGAWLHGEAVGTGMIMAADLSRRLGWLSEADVARARALILKAGLPCEAPDLGFDKYLDLMGLDKKVEGGKIRFVLLKSLGDAVLYADVPTALLQETIAASVARG